MYSILSASSFHTFPTSYDTIHWAFSERGLFAEVGGGFLDKGASMCGISVSGRLVKLLC